jgi:formamidopyrimidine-DNA glycosylase
MPELPEVESLRKNLSTVLVHKKIADIQLLRQKSFPNFAEKKEILIGQEFVEIKRRAKILDLVLSNSQHLLIHLKMTGQLIFVDKKGQRFGGGHPTADWVNKLPSKHTRVIFDLIDKRDRNSKLFFNDMRVFGWIKAKAQDKLSQEFANYGPDVNDEQLTVKYLLEKAQNRQISIKQFIMDNQVLAGIGNIYASEALFRAKISPLRKAKSISKREMTRLLLEMRQVIEMAIAFGGTTFDGHYVGVDGLAGSFQDQLAVYGQENEICPDCGHSYKIKRVKLGGRSSFYCEHCQH